MSQPGVCTWRHRWRACSWGWRVSSSGVRSRALAIPAASSAWLASSAVSVARDCSMMAVSSSLCATRSGLAAKRGSVARAGCLRMSRQRMSHSLSFWIPKKTEPSATLNGPYGGFPAVAGEVGGLHRQLPALDGTSGVPVDMTRPVSHWMSRSKAFFRR
jgi:hypothetical protein